MTQKNRIEIWRYNFEQIDNPIVNVVERSKTKYHIVLKSGEKIDGEHLSIRKNNVVRMLMKYSKYILKEMINSYGIYLFKDDLLYNFLSKRDDVQKIENCLFKPVFKNKTIHYKYMAGNKGVGTNCLNVYTYDNLDVRIKMSPSSHYNNLGENVIFGYLIDDYKKFLADKFVLEKSKNDFLDNINNVKSLFSVTEHYQRFKTTEDIVIKEYAVEKFSKIAIKELNENYKNKKENK